MKKRCISLILAAITIISMIPNEIFAVGITSEKEPVYLGTEAEYQTTFNTMFDENGLRKVQVGFNSNSGLLNEKYGLVNKYGNFVVQPIYDEIKLYANYDDLGRYGVTILPTYFIGGYTQAVRDGKMGLLNTRGEEVIPCKYDFVSLPSEGMCRVLNKVPSRDDLWYLGYWNLDQNKEVVTPNKYITTEKNTVIGILGARRKKSAGDYLAVNDFIEGHALVFTKEENNTYQATIIDKNGKDVLGKSYFIYSYGDTYENYPQKGPYLSFQEPILIKNRTFSKIDNSRWINTLTFDTYATGLAGPSGVLIKPTYTTGIKSSPGESSFFINYAEFKINTKNKTIITEKDIMPDKLYGTGYGVIDFNGNIVIPFEREELYYNENENTITGNNRLYTVHGKKLDYNNTSLVFVNGYIRALKQGTYNAKESYEPTTYYYVNTNGSYLNVTEKFNWNLKEGYHPGYDWSDFSIAGYAWIQNKDRTKWGLIDFSGNTILPFEFDEVDYSLWTIEENGYAIVEQNGKKGLVNTDGKLVVPCSYKYFSNQFLTSGSPVVEVTNDSGKVGIAEIKTGKFLLPVIYDSIGAFTNFNQVRKTYLEMGVYYVQKDNKTYLIDRNGNEVFSTTENFYEGINGLYHLKEGYCDNRGRLIFPENLTLSTNLEDIDSYTIYIKDGKVYRASANYLNSTFGYKIYAPEKATATPSSTKIMVNGKNVAVDAYVIGGNNYIKLRDIAIMVNNTDKNFEVTWDGIKNAINLISDKAYTSVGGEMAKGDGKTKTAIRTNAKIFVDGGEVSMTAYNIDGNNYFKLRDVMQIFNIGVGWDSAKSTATILTNDSYALTPYEQSKYDAHMKAYLEAGKNPYQKKPIYEEPFIQFQTTPNKLLYKVGEPFEIEGFKVSYIDIYGNGTDITKDIELKVNTTKIYDGYNFTQVGQKTVDCYYNGKKLNYFQISVIENNDNFLENGDYYMQINGKYIYPVPAGWYWLELSDKKPEKPFTVKLVKVDEKRGPMYYIMYDGTYIMQSSSKNGDQLMSSNVPHIWRINRYPKDNFCTIRDYGNQKLLVNASGEKYDNGTKVIVWSHTGSAPKHAKIVFIPAN